MLNEPEQQEVVDYVMGDLAKRLELAVGIYAAFEKLRAAVIKKFVRELVERLRTTLSQSEGWEIDPTTLLQWPLASIHTISIDIRNRHWEPGPCVQLCADNNNGPREWWFGVATPNTFANFDAVRDGLKERLGEAQTSKKEGDDHYYPWYRYFDGRWRHWTLDNWQQSQAVLALGEGGNGPYGTYLYDNLTDIAPAADVVFHRTTNDTAEALARHRALAGFMAGQPAS